MTINTTPVNYFALETLANVPHFPPILADLVLEAMEQLINIPPYRLMIKPINFYTGYNHLALVGSTPINADLELFRMRLIATLSHIAEHNTFNAVNVRRDNKIVPTALPLTLIEEIRNVRNALNTKLSPSNMLAVYLVALRNSVRYVSKEGNKEGNKEGGACRIENKTFAHLLFKICPTNIHASLGNFTSIIYSKESGYVRRTAIINNCVINNCDFSHSSFTSVVFNNCTFINTSFACAGLDECNFRNCIFINVNFYAANLHGLLTNCLFDSETVLMKFKLYGTAEFTPEYTANINKQYTANNRIRSVGKILNNFPVTMMINLLSFTVPYTLKIGCTTKYITVWIYELEVFIKDINNKTEEGLIARELLNSWDTAPNIKQNGIVITNLAISIYELTSELEKHTDIAMLGDSKGTFISQLDKLAAMLEG